MALGAESAGNFSIYSNGELYFSEDFGDLLEERNFSNFKTVVLKFLKEKKIKPDVILSDLHPDFHTTLLAQELANKYKAKYVPVQHHLAHVFSAIGDELITDSKKLKSYSLKSCLGIACDGTGLGFDEKIWGGEVFKLKAESGKLKAVRIGHLENQILIGGEMAINQPARIIIAILSKFLSKKEVYIHIKKYYSENEFEVLHNQLEQNFNCLETSSTARILDAVSVLLEFSDNARLSKHGPVDLLEKNSTKPYTLKPKLENYKLKITNFKQNSNEMLVLNTTFLFEYLIKNITKDKKRLAATAQKYIADGLLELIKTCHPEFISGSREMLKQVQHDSVFLAGGMANNKIISSILESQGVYTNKKIPRGDAGLSFGQISYYLLIK